jgi:hypothetical protein
MFSPTNLVIPSTLFSSKLLRYLIAKVRTIYVKKKDARKKAKGFVENKIFFQDLFF